MIFLLVILGLPSYYERKYDGDIDLQFRSITQFVLPHVVRDVRNMKLILSRKGFDSQNGGMASPILPDGRLLPLPIPRARGKKTMADVPYLTADGPAILADLSRGKCDLKTRIHLDPDLERADGGHLPGWRPAFGQTRAAQGHLHNKGVGQGDVFLFFGWFKQIEQHAGKWRYVPHVPDLHVLFGWIEVGKVVLIQKEREAALAEMPWIADHPHISEQYSKSNTLYVSAKRSKWLSSSPGGGRFQQYDDELRLTAPTPNSEGRSVWSLPAWFKPPDPRQSLSYHSNPKRWTLYGDVVRLQSVAKGQEFVLDMAYYPKAERWLSKLIERYGHN
ncbi:MAG: Nmad3 family putative nucleotide modification protein [Gammaproteobacteria bacterium]